MQKISASILIVLYIVVVITTAYFCAMIFTHPKKYEQEINQVCISFDIPQPLFYALVNTESGFNPKAKSNAGAIGLTQLLPTTAEYICIKNNLDYANYDLYSAYDNLYIGAMYLRYLFNRFENRYSALCAYNAGETVVRAWLNDEQYSYDKVCLYNIPYAETRNYINKIQRDEKVYKSLYGIT